MRTWLAELSAEECATLLQHAPVGRVAVVIDSRPEIFPVNHAYQPETSGIVFPTNQGTKLHATLRSPRVAFEVDGIDADGTGWSVLVGGYVELILDQQAVERAMSRRHAIWAVSEQTLWLRITPEQVTGRRIQLVP